MTRSTLFILVGLLLGACGEDEVPELSKYAEQCVSTEDCEEPLMCASGLCTISCSASPPGGCAEVDPSGRSICENTRCYIACTSQQDCPSDLECTMAGSTQGTCRAPL